MQFELASTTKKWNQILAHEMTKDYFLSLIQFLQKEYKQHTCFPPSNEILNAFNLCAFEKTKVVILGQDPYHNNNQANGLAFSVRENIKVPPSLKNILKELCDDQKIDIPTHGNLENWAKQGVLLLNSTLTVRAHQAGSHQKKGWGKFTDHIIKTISSQKENVVFVLWGSFAQKKSELIDETKHLIIKSPHPSPLSSYRGFFGSKPFGKINSYLMTNGAEVIDWKLGKNSYELF